jgi:hypothetical protein
VVVMCLLSLRVFVAYACMCVSSMFVAHVCAKQKKQQIKTYGVRSTLYHIQEVHGMVVIYIYAGSILMLSAVLDLNLLLPLMILHRQSREQ